MSRSLSDSSDQAFYAVRSKRRNSGRGGFLCRSCSPSNFFERPQRRTSEERPIFWVTDHWVLLTLPPKDLIPWRCSPARVALDVAAKDLVLAIDRARDQSGG